MYCEFVEENNEEWYNKSQISKVKFNISHEDRESIKR